MLQANLRWFTNVSIIQGNSGIKWQLSWSNSQSDCWLGCRWKQLNWNQRHWRFWIVRQRSWDRWTINKNNFIPGVLAEGKQAGNESPAETAISAEDVDDLHVPNALDAEMGNTWFSSDENGCCDLRVVSSKEPRFAECGKSDFDDIGEIAEPNSTNCCCEGVQVGCDGLPIAQAVGEIVPDSSVVDSIDEDDGGISSEAGKTNADQSWFDSWGVGEWRGWVSEHNVDVETVRWNNSVVMRHKHTCASWNRENRPKKTSCASGVERNCRNWLGREWLILLTMIALSWYGEMVNNKVVELLLRVCVSTWREKVCNQQQTVMNEWNISQISAGSRK